MRPTNACDFCGEAGNCADEDEGRMSGSCAAFGSIDTIEEVSLELIACAPTTQVSTGWRAYLIDGGEQLQMVYLGTPSNKCKTICFAPRKAARDLMWDLEHDGRYEPIANWVRKMLEKDHAGRERISRLNEHNSFHGKIKDVYCEFCEKEMYG